MNTTKSPALGFYAMHSQIVSEIRDFITYEAELDKDISRLWKDRKNVLTAVLNSIERDTNEMLIDVFEPFIERMSNSNRLHIRAKRKPKELRIRRDLDPPPGRHGNKRRHGIEVGGGIARNVEGRLVFYSYLYTTGALAQESWNMERLSNDGVIAHHSNTFKNFSFYPGALILSYEHLDQHLTSDSNPHLNMKTLTKSIREKLQTIPIDAIAAILKKINS